MLEPSKIRDDAFVPAAGLFIVNADLRLSAQRSNLIDKYNSGKCRHTRRTMFIHRLIN